MFLNRLFHLSPFFFLIFTAIACTTIQEKEAATEKSSAKTIAAPTHFEVIDSILSKEITFRNIQIDTMYEKSDAKGIKLSIDVLVSKLLLDSMQNLGFASFYINLSCITDKGLHYASMHEVGKTQRVHINKDRFIASSCQRTIEFQFPFRDLEMNEGAHDIYFQVDTYPVYFKADTSSPFYRFVDKISNQSMAYMKIKMKVSAPKLYKTAIEICKFKINTNTVNPQEFDFSMGGSGYPDLYWETYCGADFIYDSPHENNVIEYKKKCHTQPFYCTCDDVIKITFADDDNGPFNTEDDVVDSWSGKISAFHPGVKDTLSFGNMEYVIIETKILE